MRVAGRRGPVRLLFAAMVPLLPMLQFIRIAKLVASRSRKYGKLARAFPWLVLLLVSWSLGEMIGYLAGPGDSLSKWR